MSTILDLQAIEPEQEVAEAARVSTISNEHCWGWPSAVTTRYLLSRSPERLGAASQSPPPTQSSWYDLLPGDDVDLADIYKCRWMKGDYIGLAA